MGRESEEGAQGNQDKILPDEIDEVLVFGSPATGRKFLKQVAGTSAAISLGPANSTSFSTAIAAEPVAKTSAPNVVDVRLKINGKDYA